MPELDSVEQNFEATNDLYLSALDEMIAKATEFVTAVTAAQDAMIQAGLVADDAAVMFEAAAGRMNDLADAAIKADAGAQAAASGLSDAAEAAAALTAANAAATTSMGAVDAAAVTTAASTGLLGQSFFGTALTWGQALHWIVMGTLEIASTAVPAMVAFGAAVIDMAPTFDSFYDHANELITASGGIRDALLNSGGALHAIGEDMSSLATSTGVSTDAWIILGSVLEDVTGRTGTFTSMASEASNALADFATKITTDLQGQAGQELTGFFTDAVKDMEEWGAFLGNIGHTFLNVINSMWGVGKILLGVLLGISEALEAITSNAAVAWMIGLAAAMSAAYRYGQLMVSVFRWLGGTAVVQSVAGLGSAFVSMAGDIGVAAAATQVWQDMLDGLAGVALGPVGILVGAAAISFGLWYESTHQAADATTELIARVEDAPGSLDNYTNGILKLSGAMFPAMKAQDELSQSWKGGSVIAAYNTADVNDLIKAQTKELAALNALKTTLDAMSLSNAQAAASENVLAIQTELSDSRVAQLNQAWDQYIQLVTGGTSGLAAFATGLQNVTSISEGTGESVTTTTLTLAQFQQAMAQGPMGSTGAAAWTNFDSLLNSAETNVADWSQTALTAGAMTKGQFTQAITQAAQELIPFAQGNKTASSEVLALADRSGTTYTSLGQLAAAYGGVGSAASGLTGIMNTATGAMSNASQIAQNLSSVLSSDETQAIAAAALASSGFTTDIQNMIEAEKTHETVGGLTWQQWEALAQGALNGAQATATQVMNNISSTLSKPLPSIDINVTMSGTGVGYLSEAGITAQITKTQSSELIKAASGGYIRGPGTGTSDSVPAFLSHGEYVMNAAAVARIGTANLDAMNALGAKRYVEGGIAGSPGLVPQVLEATIGGGGDVHLHNSMPVSVHIGGRRILSDLRSAQSTYERRNSSTGWNLGRQGTPR